MSWPTWRLFTGAHALCVSCVVSAALWLLFTGACSVCGMRVLVVVLCPLLPPLFLRALYLFLFFFFVVYFVFKMEKGARAHCRHRHGQLMQRCSSVAFSGVRRRWVEPQWCGSRVLMHMVAGEGGFGSLSLCVLLLAG